MRYAVVLAGGWGERLWPMSTRRRPKQLLRLAGEGTLVGETLGRIAPLVALDGSLVMTSAALRSRILPELSLIPEQRVVGEPVGRNTAPAIALAAHLLVSADPDAVMIVLPADHLIDGTEAFLASIDLACRAAESERALVTLGIRPTRPETEYGYIRAGSKATTDGVLRVESFEEKPDLATAESFVAAGGYFWNSGMFVWRADRLLEDVETHLPDVARALDSVRGAPGDAAFGAELEVYCNAVPSVSIDYGIMEKSDAVLVVPASFAWDDVGSWSAMARVWAADSDGNAVEGDAILTDAGGCVVYSEDGLVAVMGLSDVIVARTGDATLVCSKDRARDVRLIVRELERRGAFKDR